MKLQLLLELGGLGSRYFHDDAQRHTDGFRDTDGVLGPHLCGQTPQKGQVGSLVEGSAEQARRQAVVDCRDPFRLRKLPALIVGNGNESRFRKFANDVGQSRRVQPAMHGREKRQVRPTEQRQRQPIHVGVDHVELGCTFRDRFEKE